MDGSPTLQRLDGRVAVVTGGGSGIGRASAQLFHREGARVVVADISGAEQDVAEQLGEHALAVSVDVTDSPQVEAMIEAAVSKFGKVDVLFNSAGIEGELSPLEESSQENFDRVISINLEGTYLGMKHAIPVMKEGGGGAIVNVASAAAVAGFPTLSTYCASKGGVVALTRGVAAECAPHGIRVNVICPGQIDTPLVEQITADSPELVEQALLATPMGRQGRAEEMASVALFLACDESSYVTGSALVADGGLTAV